ncbi:uncharacterized protein LOC135846286 isoform X3 [Planococcus citri]|uniref:uncharacterized protein LOC135846286 isoform X3 n=1 Tax=Planococcus citri TaxID=170843 RepID=UPI0031F78AF8
MFRVEEVKIRDLDLSMRPSVLMVADIMFGGYFEYLEYRRYNQSVHEGMFLIAGWSFLIAALYGIKKNQPHMLKPCVAVNLLYIVGSTIKMLPVLSNQSDQSVFWVGPFLVNSAFPFIKASATVVGLYGAMKEKLALQIPYLVVGVPSLVVTILSTMMQILNDDVNIVLLNRIVLTVALVVMLVFAAGIGYFKFIVTLKYFKECKLKYLSDFGR